MTTSERRVVVSTMTARHQVSERRVCRVLGVERTGIRYSPTRLDGLAVRTRNRKRLAVTRVRRQQVLAPNDTWGIDFVSDTLCNGRRLRACTVVDVCTHECVAIAVAHSLPSDAVISTLQRVIADRGAPIRLSLDNRVSSAVARSMCGRPMPKSLAFIQPGKLMSGRGCCGNEAEPLSVQRSLRALSASAPD